MTKVRIIFDLPKYKPPNSYYHLEVSAYSQLHPQASISKSNYGRLFSSSGNKNVIVGKAVNAFQDTIKV
jgi:hypothetical protein